MLYRLVKLGKPANAMDFSVPHFLASVEHFETVVPTNSKISTVAQKYLVFLCDISANLKIYQHCSPTHLILSRFGAVCSFYYLLITTWSCWFSVHLCVDRGHEFLPTDWKITFHNPNRTAKQFDHLTLNVESVKQQKSKMLTAHLFETVLWPFHIASIGLYWLNYFWFSILFRLIRTIEILMKNRTNNPIGRSNFRTNAYTEIRRGKGKLETVWPILYS